MRLPDTVDVILVPLDGSQFAQRALPVAYRLAGRLDADIHLMSAVAKEGDVGAREAELAAVELPGRRVLRGVVVDHDPARAIHEMLRAFPHAVACMASHGRGRSAALVGSVASDVVARGHDPSVVVGPLLGERLHSHGIVASVDDSPASAPLILVALRWADLLGESLAVITVGEMAPEPLWEGPVRRRFGPDGDPAAFLEDLVEPIRDQRPDVETVAVYDPISPAEGVRRYLRDHPAFLLVVSSRPHSGPARVFSGSIAAAIVHHSPTPVLVVPRPL